VEPLAQGALAEAESEPGGDRYEQTRRPSMPAPTAQKNLPSSDDDWCAGDDLAMIASPPPQLACRVGLNVSMPCLFFGRNHHIEEEWHGRTRGGRAFGSGPGLTSTGAVTREIDSPLLSSKQDQQQQQQPGGW
jgi:hypothetical protein